MEISSQYVGVPLREYRTVISWRDTMNYAAALDDSNPLYFDDEHEEGIIAPPLFAVAVTWPVIEHIGEYIEASDFPREVLLTQVHFTEHLELHRPLKPGDALTVKGRIAAILPRRAGTYVVMRFDAVDAEGAPVFTEHIGAMMRGVSCAGEGRGNDALPQVPSSPGGIPLWESPVFIDALRPFVYDGCSRIFFPSHTSRRFAHDVGLPDISLQGTATLGFALRELINKEAGGDPRRVKALACRFTGMVLPGTEITVTLEAREEGGRGLFFAVSDSAGNKVIKDGYALLDGE